MELCGSKSTASQRLSQVWQSQGEIDKKDYKYLRLNPGFCRTSVKCIASLINKEKERAYTLCHGKSDWSSDKDLSQYTNCMLFVIRLCKLCEMQIPEWNDIVDLFDEWQGSNRWETHWAHFKLYAKAEW